MDVEVAVVDEEVLVVDVVFSDEVVFSLELEPVDFSVESLVLSGSPSSGSSGVSEGGGLGPPGDGFPEGFQPPPKPQLLSLGQSKGMRQPPLPPSVPEPEPQISPNSLTQPQATVGLEPFEVVIEVAVKTTLLVSSPLVILTV